MINLILSMYNSIIIKWMNKIKLMNTKTFKQIKKLNYLIFLMEIQLIQIR